MFFVLSGFLITWLLLRENDELGTVSLRKFYIRRSLRIFPAFYCYAAPTPTGFEKQTVRPAEAFYDSALGEYLLMYDDVRLSRSPTATLLEFLQSTYEAGATTGNWDRQALEQTADATAA